MTEAPVYEHRDIMHTYVSNRLIMNEETNASSTTADPSKVTVPIVEEQLEVTRERRSTGSVRVRIEVDESVDKLVVGFGSEEFTTRVVPIDTEVQHRVTPHQDGDDLVIPVYEERSVVVRRLILLKEIRLTSVRRIAQEPLEVPVRRERAVIERQMPDGSWVEDDSAS